MYIRIKTSSYEELHSLTIGKLYKVTNNCYKHDNGFEAMYMGKKYCAHIGGYWEIFNNNRYLLRQFITKNKIDMKATSLMLGKSKAWLATMCYESKRGDIKQSSLDRIIAALSIDWTSKTTVMVNSKGYVPYSTIHANYSRTQDKARLMKAYLNGDVS